MKLYFKSKQLEFAEKCVFLDGYCVHLKRLPRSRWQITPLGGSWDDTPQNHPQSWLAGTGGHSGQEFGFTQSLLTSAES